MPIARRPLQFNSLAEIVAEAEHLHQGGYDPAGKWDLAQVCGHLADWSSYPMDGCCWDSVLATARCLSPSGSRWISRGNICATMHKQ